MKVHPAQKLTARIGGLYAARTDDFETTAVTHLDLDFGGIVDDVHHGVTRGASSREPWYSRSTELRNERQVTILSTRELAEIAAEMGVASVVPEWIGGNMLLDGIAHLSMLPASTLLYFEGGVTIKVDLQNVPCRIAGGRIAQRYPDEDATSLALSFKDAAKRRRGLTAWVEKPGRLEVGETAKIVIPEQWIYTSEG